MTDWDHGGVIDEETAEADEAAREAVARAIPVEIVRVAEGFFVEVNGAPRGTTFPSLSLALGWLRLMLDTPLFASGEAKIAFSDRREWGERES